jgi:hypothetical protein
VGVDGSVPGDAVLDDAVLVGLPQELAQRTTSVSWRKRCPTHAVLVAGGFDIPGSRPGGMILASAEIFDPHTGMWSAAGNMSVARFDFEATLMNDGRVLVTGGTGSDGAVESSGETFDPEFGTN